VLAGETHLFELVMRRNNTRVFRAVRAVLRNDVEAEDAMQDAYVNAYVHLADFEGRAKLSTWLTRIAVHEAFARLRRSRRVTSLDETDSESQPMHHASPHSTPESNASDGELRVVLERAIDELPEHFRVVFVLRAVQEMSGAETAEALSIPEETVKTRLFRARSLLQKALTERAESVTSSAFGFHLSRCDRVVAAVMARLPIRRPV
jgi:RNA polymerase sigma-70 factor (ECF subfamily)